MGRLIWGLGLFVLVVASFPPTVRADDWDACLNANADVKIFGCSAIIDAGKDTNANIATVHYHRVNAFYSKGDYDRTIKDYDKVTAIKFSPLLFYVPSVSQNSEILHLTEERKLTEREKFRPIQLTCPGNVTGTLTLISMNLDHQSELYEVDYKNGTANAVRVMGAEKNGKFEPAIQIDMARDKDKVGFGFKLTYAAGVLLKSICNGTAAAIKEYRATLKANMALIGLEQKNYPSNF